MNWTHEFDRLQCDFGMPSLFTLSHEGEIRLDVKRTRDFYTHNPHWTEDISSRPPSPKHKNFQQHLIAVDHRTKIPQYILISTKKLCEHPQFELISCSDYVQAMQKLQQYKERAFEEHRKRRKSTI